MALFLERYVCDCVTSLFLVDGFLFGAQNQDSDRFIYARRVDQTQEIPLQNR